MERPVFIDEKAVKELLTWSSIFESVEEALKSVGESQENNVDQPISSMPARTLTAMPDRSGILFAMPGFIGNYSLPSLDSKGVTKKKYQTLACKLVTAFNKNEKMEKPIPNILGTIFIFDDLTGKLNCILEGTEITAWRTATASIVSTHHLFFQRTEVICCDENKILSIVGCGIQGRMHAIGMCSIFKFSEVRLWNRSTSKAETLLQELEAMSSTFKNPNIKIIVAENIQKCVENADVIVTATFSSDPLIQLNYLKPDCHINGKQHLFNDILSININIDLLIAVGAGFNHHSELSAELYLACNVYVDNWASARTELQTLKANIVGQVGDVINKKIQRVDNGITVFQSMGMAVEDAAVGQMIFEMYKKNAVK